MLYPWLRGPMAPLIFYPWICGPMDLRRLDAGMHGCRDARSVDRWTRTSMAAMSVDLRMHRCWYCCISGCLDAWIHKCWACHIHAIWIAGCADARMLHVATAVCMDAGCPNVRVAGLLYPRLPGCWDGWMWGCLHARVAGCRDAGCRDCYMPGCLIPGCRDAWMAA